MGLFSASSLRVTQEVSEAATERGGVKVRRLLAAAGVVLWLGFLVPPLSDWSHRYEYVAAMQFCFFAAVVPSFIVIGAPWRSFSSDTVIDTAGVGDQQVSSTRRRLIDRCVGVRLNPPGRQRAVVIVLLFIALTVIWRSAPAVDALVRHQWLAVVESFTLVPVGVLLWLELIDSPPFKPGTSRPYRIGMVAATMWTIWVIAYLGAMSGPSWYSAFHYVAGQGVSRAADQQLTAGVMWMLSAAAFLPLVFWNLIQWLQTEEDPDDELYRLVRQERSQGFFGTDS